MIDSLRNATAEGYALFSAVGSVIVAAVFSQIEWLSFGTFVQMLAAFLAADVLFYAAMKLGWIRSPRMRNRT